MPHVSTGRAHPRDRPCPRRSGGTRLGGPLRPARPDPGRAAPASRGSARADADGAPPSEPQDAATPQVLDLHSAAPIRRIFMPSTSSPSRTIFSSMTATGCPSFSLMAWSRGPSARSGAGDAGATAAPGSEVSAGTCAPCLRGAGVLRTRVGTALASGGRWRCGLAHRGCRHRLVGGGAAAVRVIRT
jgi:hypothetical protein